MDRATIKPISLPPEQPADDWERILFDDGTVRLSSEKAGRVVVTTYENYLALGGEPLTCT